jgi:hypothetical protein
VLTLTYVSSATELMDDDQLVTLLRTIRPINEQLGITGMMLYRGGNIIQTLEGPTEAVKATYDRIRRDPRHRGVILLWQEEVTERHFADWSMGFHNATGLPLDDLEGYTDFLQGDLSEKPPEVVPAVVLLRSFRETMR